MQIPLLRFATIVTCLVLCSAPYQVQQAHSNAFIFDGHTFTTIDVPGAKSTGASTEAFGVNDGGQIVGIYGLPQPSPVPESSSLLLLGCGLLGLAAWRWKHAS